MLEYSIQLPEFQEILDFLKRSDDEFDKPLSSKLDLDAYACKLWENSAVVTCRDNGVIVGMLNCYVNRPPLGFISNVCVLGAYQGKGAFTKMFSMLCRHCWSQGVEMIALEVNKGNEKALKAYLEIGFVISEDRGGSWYMIFHIPKVSVICCAYNQESYIRECIDGLVNQDTSFRYEIIIHDDASADGTADIIREYHQKYPDLIRPICQRENQYSRKTGILKTFVYPRLKGKYVAICEGDDYWTDPKKLQKQVEVLEAEPHYSMCSTACDRHVQETGETSAFFPSVQRILSWENLLKKNCIANLTTLVRTEYLVEYNRDVSPTMPSFPMGDYPMWLFMASKGPVIQLADNTATYRILARSASHFPDPKEMIAFEVAAVNVAIWSNKKYRFGKKGLSLRKLNVIRKKCRKVSRKTGKGSFGLVLWGLWYGITHPSPRVI